MLFLFWFYHLPHIFLSLCLHGRSLSCDLLAFLVCFWCGETSSSSQPLLVVCWARREEEEELPPPCCCCCCCWCLLFFSTQKAKWKLLHNSDRRIISCMCIEETESRHRSQVDSMNFSLQLWCRILYLHFLGGLVMARLRPDALVQATIFEDLTCLPAFITTLAFSSTHRACWKTIPNFKSSKMARRSCRIIMIFQKCKMVLIAPGTIWSSTLGLGSHTPRTRCFVFTVFCSAPIN